MARALAAAVAAAALLLPGSRMLRAQPAVADAPAWRCAVVYLPARSTWVRDLALRLDPRGIVEVRIDGQPVHTFAVDGTTLLTSMDNERIAVDVADGVWVSDFRGQASGRGRCERAAARAPD